MSFWLSWLFGNVACTICKKRTPILDPLGKGWKYLYIPWNGPNREWCWFCPDHKDDK